MRSTEMVLFAPFLKTSKFLPAYISIYIISLYYSYLILTPRQVYPRLALLHHDVNQNCLMLPVVLKINAFVTPGGFH